MTGFPAREVRDATRARVVHPTKVDLMPQFLDSIQKTVDSVLAQREEFDRAYGRNAVALLEQAPHAVRMMGRMVMDLDGFTDFYG